MNIEISSEVASKIINILSSLDEPYLGMRLGIQGGGCSGFQYVIAPCFETDEMDTVLEKNGLKIYVDSFSMQYLDGATIKYENNNLGQNIIISNPNSVGSCGCGNSFYT